MIQIEDVHIEEFRGIRKLDLPLGRKSFCICGPNGSGKSGVVDGIEFALTGDISRLSGEGTGGLSVAKHGAHVDKRDDLDASLVRLTVRILASGKFATITRRLKKPKELLIESEDPNAKAVLEEVARHKEITLSRREIIKFILTKATDRSRDVQTLLKLDEIDDTRAVLKTASNRLGRQAESASAQFKTASDDLRRHLDVSSLTPEAVLEVVNKRRAVLGLPSIKELDKKTTVSEGVAASGGEGKASVHKKSALQDIDAFTAALSAGLDADSRDHVATASKNVAELEADPALLSALKKRAFVETGLGFIEGPSCPLCDQNWDAEQLRAHLQTKLEQSKLAEAIQGSLLSAGSAIRNAVQRGRARIQNVSGLAEKVEASDLAAKLGAWDKELETFQQGLSSVDGLIGAKATLEEGWARQPDGLLAGVEALREVVQGLPDESGASEAQKFLIVAQERLDKRRDAWREEERCRRASKAASVAYAEYCKASEGLLEALYEEVEAEFAKFYRTVNRDDEGEFEADLSPSAGKLELEVDFYKRGKFPPGAYHSEGHQDGMGLCLYLALMRRVLGPDFRLAVLDDVVMSVDKDHRKQFCKLLKDEFPETQFIITTHDKTWAKQMNAAGLIPAKAAVAFRGWTVDKGPLVHEIEGVWDEIAEDLAKDRVSSAAGTLRRHLEFVFREIADDLVAPIPFRADDGWDLGDLYPGVIARYKDLLGRAAKAAQDRGNTEAAAKVQARKKALAEKAAACGGEQWMINKAIHYNEWEDLTPGEFRQVVDAFRSILAELRCKECGAWLRVMPKRVDAETLRCDCGELLNLVGVK